MKQVGGWRCMREVLRLFVALYPPMAWREAACAHASAMVQAGAMVTSAEQAHLTLVFIGETIKKRVHEVEESVSRSASGIGPIELRPMRLVTLPEKGPPRLIAIQMDAPARLLELQRRLANRLAKPSERNSRAFVPHVTVARLGGSASAGSMHLDAVMPGCLEAVLQETGPAFTCTDVRLMSSQLRADGAVHHVVATVPL